MAVHHVLRFERRAGLIAVPISGQILGIFWFGTVPAVPMCRLQTHVCLGGEPNQWWPLPCPFLDLCSGCTGWLVLLHIILFGQGAICPLLDLYHYYCSILSMELIKGFISMSQAEPRPEVQAVSCLDV